MPEFAAPPLFETVFGVRFPRLANWDIPHFGLFWNQIRDRFPHFEVRPPVPAPGLNTRTFDGFTLQLGVPPEVRCWFLGPEKNRIVQVQNDGFFFNWRKVTLDEVYPRYLKAVRPAFSNEWDGFRSFLAREEIGVPDVVECEATYVNHLVRGHEWESIDDLHRMLRIWAGPDPELAPPTAVHLTAQFEFGSDVLNLSLVPAVRRTDGAEIFQLTLSVKGSPRTDGVMEWMDAARANIVQTFARITTSEMHDLWNREAK